MDKNSNMLVYNFIDYLYKLGRKYLLKLVCSNLIYVKTELSNDLEVLALLLVHPSHN